ncbi:MAG TPA: PP2C family serine/threonine-protein phosphatase, partial [Anaerolineae bacterium]|nr:PP2C family serine/threonine-protein phosphatase [Anaerolineae bacterium]
MNLIRKMFASPEDADGLMTDAEDDQTRSAGAAPAVVRRLRVGRASDVGRVRSHNEDALLTIESQFDGDEPLTPFGVYIVADGMGGHLAGEVASSLAARVVANQVMRDVYSPYVLQTIPTPDQVPLTTALETAVEAANQAVHSQVPGSGTTLTCALVIDARAYLAHVGDSRAYLYYNQHLKQVTKDHSYVDKLVELGQLTIEAAAAHPQRNVLYRAVGQGEQLEIDLHLIDLPIGSRLLLCCDGLWGMLRDPVIQVILASAETPQDACTELIAAANEAGGRDNITAII